MTATGNEKVNADLNTEIATETGTGQEKGTAKEADLAMTRATSTGPTESEYLCFHGEMRKHYCWLRSLLAKSATLTFLLPPSCRQVPHGPGTRPAGAPRSRDPRQAPFSPTAGAGCAFARRQGLPLPTSTGEQLLRVEGLLLELSLELLLLFR